MNTVTAIKTIKECLAYLAANFSDVSDDNAVEEWLAVNAIVSGINKQMTEFAKQL